jgi:hypothetical protein
LMRPEWLLAGLCFAAALFFLIISWNAFYR